MRSQRSALAVQTRIALISVILMAVVLMPVILAVIILVLVRLVARCWPASAASG